MIIFTVILIKGEPIGPDHWTRSGSGRLGGSEDALVARVCSSYLLKSFWLLWQGFVLLFQKNISQNFLAFVARVCHLLLTEITQKFWLLRYSKGLSYDMSCSNILVDTDLASVQVMNSLGPSINSAIAAAMGGGSGFSSGASLTRGSGPITTFQVSPIWTLKDAQDHAFPRNGTPTIQIKAQPKPHIVVVKMVISGGEIFPSDSTFQLVRGQ